ncbi:MAG TPA: TAT-variant-translocated molybdopterin oxidoreductase, partial [Candidatus Angelobacter sp.]|nr:TAT-variant-translocated molybdopterin oxidoreductase [Candidatus Angelobacter sp.]
MSKTSDSNPSLVPASAIKPARPEVEAVRKQLAEGKGPKFWRSLEELSGQQEAAFGELLEREFPRQHSEWLDPVSRRNFLKLAGASMALAGLAGCTKQPLEQILPYVRQPEDLVPGKPIFYATAMPFAGYGLPLLVETHEFRPTKVEGNPDHPCSKGATDLFAQASILGLYDPDRSIVLTYRGEPRPWGDFLSAMRGRVLYHKANQGAGLRFLTGAVSSPTLGSQMKAILQIFPQAKWHRWDPVHRDGARAGAKLAFGAQYDPQYKFDAADIVVSLDADFLSGAWFRGFVRYARDFMSRRQPADGGKEMNRFYAAESSPTTTGAKADHRLVLRQSEVEKIARALAAKTGVGGVTAAALSEPQQKWVDAVAADLLKHRGKSLVVPGEFQSATVNALAHAINAQLGNIGQTVTYSEPIEIDAVEHAQSIRELAADMAAGKVETLVMIGGNPVYNAPVDANFQAGLEKLIEDGAKREQQGGSLPPQRVIQLSLYDNDTTPFCHWHVPEAHYLESWSDVRAHDGTASIIQPMIAPLYDGKSAHEILAIFTDNPGTSGYDLLQSYWRSQHTGDDFDQWWRKSVHDGYIAGSAFPARTAGLKLGALPEREVRTAMMVFAPAGAQMQVVEVMFRPDPTIYDGAFINNAWLQETPKPLTRTTWDNIAMISPAMAARMGFFELEGETIAKSDLEKNVNKDHQSDAQKKIEINVGGRIVEAPAWTQPGHPDNAITVFFGYGQKKTGRVGLDRSRSEDKPEPRGYDAYS